MYSTIYFIIVSVISISLIGCGSGSSNNDNNSPTSQPIAETPEVIESPEVYTLSINGDGADSGEHIYTIIRNALGQNAMEAPEFYENDHTQVEHLYEDYDEEVGEHFVLTIHRDIDGNKGVFEGRQRNEFKVYGSSDERLKGYENTSFEYNWKMKINNDMQVSENFTHFFQLKPVGGDDGTPTFTLTGAERSGEDVLEIRYQVPDIEDEKLATLDFNNIKGQWLSLHFKATFANNGTLFFTIKKTSDNSEILTLDYSNIDLWIGESDEHYQRPKWGIVRSLEDLDNLREEEETVRFANIEITHL